MNANVCSVESTESQKQHETHPDDPGPSTSETNINESTENSDKDSMKYMTQNTFISSFKRQKTINESFTLLNYFKEDGHKFENGKRSTRYLKCVIY